MTSTLQNLNIKNINGKLTLKCSKTIKNLKLQQTDAQSLPAATNDLPKGFISPDGRQVYVLYTSFESPAIAAQFGSVDNQGRITFNVTIPADPTYVNVNDGWANQSFTEFTILEDDDISTGRIRVINSSGVTLSTRFFTNIVPGDFVGGSWSYDDQFISIFTVAPPEINAVLRVLDRTLATLVTGPTLPSIQIQDPLWFTLPSEAACKSKNSSKKKKCCVNPTDLGTGYYISISFSTGVRLGCPDILRIFQFTGHSIVTITETLLPAYGIGLATWPNKPTEILNACHSCDSCSPCKTKCHGGGDKDKEKKEEEEKFKIKNRATRPFALIAVNTIVATAPNEVTPYVTPTPSCLVNSDNADELRLYAFDGFTLSLAASINTRGRGGGVTFTPDGRFLLYEGVVDLLNNSAALPGAAILNTARVPLDKICKFYSCEKSSQKEKDKDKNREWCDVKCPSQNKNNIDGCLEIVNSQFGYANSYVLSVSTNMEWFFVVTGNPSSGANAGDIFPIQLYHIDRIC